MPLLHVLDIMTTLTQYQQIIWTIVSSVSINMMPRELYLSSSTTILAEIEVSANRPERSLGCSVNRASRHTILVITVLRTPMIS